MPACSLSCCRVAALLGVGWCGHPKSRMQCADAWCDARHASMQGVCRTAVVQVRVEAHPPATCTHQAVFKLTQFNLGHRRYTRTFFSAAVQLKATARTCRAQQHLRRSSRILRREVHIKYEGAMRVCTGRARLKVSRGTKHIPTPCSTGAPQAVAGQYSKVSRRRSV